MNCYQLLLVLLSSGCWGVNVCHGASIVGGDQYHHYPDRQEYYFHGNPNEYQEEVATAAMTNPLESSAPPTDEKSAEPGISIASTLEKMALSLRFACEMNRRLCQGTITTHPCKKLAHDVQIPASRPMDGVFATSNYHIDQGTEHATNRNEQVLPHSNEKESKLTLFHAKYPISRKQNKVLRGSSRWGPDLSKFLHRLSDALRIESTPVVLYLAMMYLDRACSEETPRSFASSLSPCPYVTPRTVHRLVIAAVVIAMKQVHGGTTREYWEKIQSLLLDVSFDEFQQSLFWMTGATGDIGLYVEQNDVFQWKHAWDCSFSSQSSLE